MNQGRKIRKLFITGVKGKFYKHSKRRKMTKKKRKIPLPLYSNV